MNKPQSHQKRLVDPLDRFHLFIQGRSESFKAHRSAIEFLDDYPEKLPVGFLEPKLVDVEHLKGVLHRFLSNDLLSVYLGVIAGTF